MKPTTITVKWYNRRPGLFMLTIKGRKGYFLMRVFGRLLIYYKDSVRWPVTSKEQKANSSRIFFDKHYVQVLWEKKKGVSLVKNKKS